MATEASYVDTSAFLRVLYRVPGASAFDGSNAVLACSEIVRVELALAIDRRRLANELDAETVTALRRDADRLVSAVHLFPLSDEVLQHAMQPFPMPVPLRTALHVATAQVVAREVSRVLFWTWSDADAAAAATRKMVVQGLSPRA